MDDQSREYERSAAKTDVPAIGMTFDQRLDDYRHVVFQTFVAADCAQGEINAALDKVRKAAERQKAIAHLPTLRGLLEDKEAALKAEIAKYYEVEISRGDLNNRRAAEAAKSDRRNPKPSNLDVAEDAKINQALASGRSVIEQLQKAILIDKRNIANAEQLITDGE